MAGDVSFINGIEIGAWWNTLLNGLLTDMVNEIPFWQDLSSISSMIWLTQTRALNLSQKFTAISWPLELDPISENWLKPQQQRDKMPDKWFLVNEYGGQIDTSYLARKWIEKSQALSGADPSVQAGWNTFLDNGTFLLKGALKNIAIDAIRLLEKGFSISTAYWPWSPTPKGKALFTTDHSTRGGGITFRNVLTTPNQSLSSSSLQDALNIHKTELRYNNWYRVEQPRWAYQLWCGRKLAVTARWILNTGDNKAGIFSGTWNNANQLNTFNMVEIVEIPLMWDTDKNGNSIWSDTMWFLVNMDMLRTIKWFRMITLYDPYIKNYLNEATDSYVVDCRLWFAIDHYGAESCIVWSQGTV